MTSKSLLSLNGLQLEEAMQKIKVALDSALLEESKGLYNKNIGLNNKQESDEANSDDSISNDGVEDT